MEKSAVIIDLDGTLCRKCDREDNDLSKVRDDHLNPEIATLARVYARTGHRVIILTARREFSRKVTQEWLAENFVQHDELFMRPDVDTRPDWVVKREIYMRQIKPQYDVDLIVDNDEEVISVFGQMDVVGLLVRLPE